MDSKLIAKLLPTILKSKGQAEITVMGISIVLMILSIIKIKQNTSSKLKKKYK